MDFLHFKLDLEQDPDPYRNETDLKHCYSSMGVY